MILFDLLKQEIKNKIIDKNYKENIINLLKIYKNNGLSKNDAIELLESIRTELDEKSEDRLLEILDFVAGFCSKDYKIW